MHLKMNMAKWYYQAQHLRLNETTLAKVDTDELYTKGGSRETADAFQCQVTLHAARTIPMLNQESLWWQVQSVTLSGTRRFHTLFLKGSRFKQF